MSHEITPFAAIRRTNLAAKRADPAADTTALERAINRHVYTLYALTPDEIKLVEASAERP